MKRSLAVLIWSLLVTHSHSEPVVPTYPPTEVAFSKLSFRQVAQKNLPNRVFFWALQGAESNEDPNYVGRVCYLDLDQDGIDEIIVESPATRTSQYEFWQKRKGRWISLLMVWGAPELLQRRNGYYQIAVRSEGRQGDGTKELYVFEGERYHLIRLDRYQDDAFVRTDDVQEREKVMEHNFKGQFR